MTRRLLLWLAALGPIAAARAQARPGWLPLDSAALRAAAAAADAPFAPLARRVTVHRDRAPLGELVAGIAAQAGLGHVVDPALAGLDRRVTLHADGVPAARALADALRGAPLRALVSPAGQLVLVAAPNATGAPPLAGTVRDAADAPLAGARVELVGTGHVVLTDAAGRFALPPIALAGAGPAVTLRVLALGYRPALVRAERGAAAPVRVALERAVVSLASVVVTPGTFGMLQTPLAVPQTLSRQQIEALPQIGEDIYRVMTRLPGVTSDDFSASFVVRGGTAGELYTTLDGLELIDPFHLPDIGGALSIVDVQAIGGVELNTGGFGAEIGDRLTGTFAMRSVDPRTDRTHGAAGISVTNTRLMAQGGFARGAGGWLVSARRGYIDLALKLAGANDSLSPRYGDVFAKVQLDLPARWPVGGRVAAHLLRADDRLRYLEGASDPSLESRYGSTYGWFTWDGRVGGARGGAPGGADAEPRVRQRTVLSWGRLDWNRHAEDFSRGTRTAQVDDARDLAMLGARQDWTAALSRRALLKWGADVRRESAEYAYLKWRRTLVPAPVMVNGVRAQTPRWDTTAVDASPAGTRLGAYVAQRVRPLDALTLEVGGRVDRAVGGGAALLSPRANVAWTPRAGTTLRGAWGRATQGQSVLQLQVQDGLRSLFPPERAEHRVLGWDQLLPDGVVGRVEAYERRLTQLRPRFVNVGPGIDLAPELASDRLRVDARDGVARGVELSLGRGDGRRVDWSASYAWARATQRVPDSAGALRTVARSWDQRHTVQGAWSVHPADGRWRLSVAGLWRSGWPFTPLVVHVDTLVNTERSLSISSTVAPGALNGERLPAYQRVDARWTRWFATPRGRVAVFAEVFNLFGTKNVRGYRESVGLQQRQLVQRRVAEFQLPRIPSAGVSWEF